MIAGYLRVSTCKQHLTNQKEEIQRYAAARNFCVDTWVTEIVSGKKNERERKRGGGQKKSPRESLLGA